VNWEVRKINKSIAERVVCKKHYSGRLGIFWEGFGLFEREKLLGVCCFGQPSPPIQRHAFRDRDFRLYELTRMVVDEGLNNAGSFLIARSLKMLSQKPCAVVSYADSMHGHCGIVYQASNWIYTGATKSHDKLYRLNGKIYHPMTLRDHFGVTDPMNWVAESPHLNVEVIPPMEKHRYFIGCGSKKEKSSILSKLKYKTLPYPKVEKSLYDAGDLSCDDARIAS
jgi:hypothetical protein